MEIQWVSPATPSSTFKVPTAEILAAVQSVTTALFASSGKEGGLRQVVALIPCL